MLGSTHLSLKACGLCLLEQSVLGLQERTSERLDDVSSVFELIVKTRRRYWRRGSIYLSVGWSAEVDCLLLAVVAVKAEHARLRPVSVSQQQPTDEPFPPRRKYSHVGNFVPLTRARGSMSEDSAEQVEAPEVKTFTELGLDDRLLKVGSTPNHPTAHTTKRESNTTTQHNTSLYPL